MTRLSYQQGYVSEPIRTRRGIAFKIRYRVHTAQGKWKQKAETLYGLSGKKTARAILEQKIREASGRKVEAAELTFTDFVESYWKPYLDRRNVKPSTRLSYEVALGRHLHPVLGDMHLAGITPLHIEDLLQSKLKSGLSPKTVLNLLRLMQGIFSLAVDNDLIARSPIRKKHRPEVPRREKPAWRPEQVRAIIEAMPQQHRAFFVCAALTGARQGELLGLQWKHVDFEARKLRIEHSLWNGQLVTPKTPKSERVVPFGEVLSQVLKEHLESSLHTGAEDFVFCRPDGSPLRPDQLRRDVLRSALDRLGIPRVKGASGFHAFRHSAGSIINAQTGNLKLAQKLLGHSNLSTTADIYTHTAEEAERGAAVAMEQAIFGDLFPVVPKTGNRNKSVAVN
jgi:integrase